MKKGFLFQKKIVSDQSWGFTLIEMLVVLSVLAILGGLLVTIFTRTLRGNNKSQIIGVIKQNGQAVLENMDKSIRNADYIVCISSLTPPGPTIVVNKDDKYSRFRFIAPRGGGLDRNDCMLATDLTTNPTNGCVVQDSPIQPASPSPQSDIKLFIDNVCIGLMSGASIITDTNPQTGVSVQFVPSSTITKNTSAGFKDTVTINFQVAHGVLAPQAVAGQIDPVTFQTTIQLR